MMRNALRWAGEVTGPALVACAAAVALAAPYLAPYRASDRFPSLLNAPPTRIHVVDSSGQWRRPFIYAWHRTSQLEQQYDADTSAPVPLTFLSHGRLLRSSDEARAPLLLLGSDSFGRDVLSRILYGARVSLALAVMSVFGALAIGAVVGGAAGYLGGVADDWLMRATEFVAVLPMMYAALALRAVMPLVLTPSEIFLLLLAIFSILGVPLVAKGVRGIIQSERAQEYALAARSLGAGHVRILGRHLLPAARGFLLVQAMLLMPAFIVAEATFSYIGFGCPEPVATWGTMLQEASSLRALADFPWLLSPAIALFLVVLGLNLTALPPKGDRQLGTVPLP
jgi:peptide/nickel transport system permease protein